MFMRVQARVMPCKTFWEGISYIGATEKSKSDIVCILRTANVGISEECPNVVEERLCDVVLWLQEKKRTHFYPVSGKKCCYSGE